MKKVIKYGGLAQQIIKFFGQNEINLAQEISIIM
jgi:hypothetical protein